MTSFNKSTYLQDNPDEEQQLLQLLAAGDIRAFWPLWEKYQDYLFRCCLSWTNGNSVEAEDLLSQAMLKAREKVQKYAGKIANLKAWLAALIRNFWLDIKRRGGANQVEDIEAYAAQQEDLGLVAVGDTPASALERDEKKMVIRRAIDNLQPRLRETFILHFYEELSYPEIAERQNIKYPNVCKRISQAREILALELRGYFIGEDGTEPDTAKVPAKPAKSKKAVQKAAQVEPILPETVILSEQLEESEEVSHQEMGEGQEIFCQNVEERICEAREILGGEDGTKMELAVMPVGRELGIEEMSQGNGGVEPVVGVPVTKSVAVVEVECVVGEELPVVAGSVGDSESDSVVGSSGGRLEEFNFMGKRIVGAFSRWLHYFGGSQLFYGIRELMLEVRGEWCRWCGATMGAGGECCGRICASVAISSFVLLSLFSINLNNSSCYLQAFRFSIPPDGARRDAPLQKRGFSLVPLVPLVPSSSWECHFGGSDLKMFVVGLMPNRRAS